MGTDSAVGPHGANLRELPLMVENGMTPMQAVVASTRSCAELLGIAGQRGTLEAGKAADVVAVRGDPIADIGLLGDAAKVRIVVKDGEVVC
jgi:imidazolonepropionase-like amidohydrolase